MKLERTKNAKRNIFFGLINKTVTLFFPFIVRAVLTRIIGVEYAGLNSLFSSILQVLNLTELGFSSAVVYSMYKPIVDNDEEKICALLNFYRKIYFVIGLIILAVGLLITPLLPYLINNQTCPQEVNLYILYFVYLANTSISYLLYGYKNALLSAHQRTDIISNIVTITQGALYVGQIFVIYLTRSYYVYILLMPLFTIINNIMVSKVVNKKYPRYICAGEIDSETLNTIKKKVAGLMVNKLCYTTRNTFDSIFISAFFGLSITAIYGNYYAVIAAVIGMISVITTSMLAGVGNGIQTESIEKNYLNFKKFNFMYMWLSGWCTICLLCLFQPFMTLWMGEDYLFSFSLVVLLCIYFYALKMGDIRGVYSDAAGLWWENRYRAIIEAVANLILNFALVQVWGVHGIIVATLIPLLIVNFGGGSQIVYKHYFKNGKIGEYFLLHGKYALITLIIGGITMLVCSWIKIDNCLGLLIVRGIICIILPNLLYFGVYCKMKEFKEASHWLKMSVLKKK